MDLSEALKVLKLGEQVNRGEKSELKIIENNIILFHKDGDYTSTMPLEGYSVASPDIKAYLWVYSDIGMRHVSNSYYPTKDTFIASFSIKKQKIIHCVYKVEASEKIVKNIWNEKDYFSWV